jgi:hypothetical protein
MRVVRLSLPDLSEAFGLRRHDGRASQRSAFGGSERRVVSKLAGDGGVSDGAYPTASAQVYYQELVMGEDQSENAAPQMDAQETISAEETQDNIYEADVCVPLEYKVRGERTVFIHRCPYVLFRTVPPISPGTCMLGLSIYLSILQ